MKKYAKPGPSGALEWSYGGGQNAPNRRVSVVPYAMLGDIIYLSGEARGVLLTLFCRSWGQVEAVRTEVLRERGLSKRRFRAIIDEIVNAGVARERRDTIAPTSSFGADPKSSAVATAARARSMPSDWADLREAVFERDGYACIYCGSGRDLHCDHVEPLSRGGGHEITNLATACATCNLSKSGKTLDEWRPGLSRAVLQLIGGGFD